jgi:hypothetical protein
MLATKRVTDRRPLSFDSLDAILADAEALGAGKIRTSGNWTAAQIVQHVGKLICISVEGADFKAPWYVRLGGRLMKKPALTRTWPAGIKPPKQFDPLAPDDDVTWDQAIDELRTNIARAKDVGMTHPSPLLGPLSNEQWIQLHCRHAELHFSFMHPVG